jgi:class 3 adenylate cyclase
MLGLFCFTIQNLSGQDQKIADSLIRIYQENTLNDTARLELLRNLAFNEMKPTLAIKYADELINVSKQSGNSLYLYRGYLQKGYKIKSWGNFGESLDAFFKGLEAAEKANYVKGEATSYIAIADTYSAAKDRSNALLYYNKGLEILRKGNDSVTLAGAIFNAGDEYFKKKNYDSALLYFSESKNIFNKVNDLVGEAYSLGGIGTVHAKNGKNNLAEKNINEAIRILEAKEDYNPICEYLLIKSDIYRQEGDGPSALNYAKRSLYLAQQYGLKEQISNANLKLSELYERAGNLVESYKYYKIHIAYRDSLHSIDSVQKMFNLRTNYEVAKKQAAVDQLNQEKRNQRMMVIYLFIILGLITVLLGTVYWFYRNISKEKKRSESLLLNILPAETAKELMENGKVNAVKFDEVTVLFTDFIEFSKFAEHIEPEQLVKSIDFYFKKFDEITTKYGLEKIKTIGDSYMCACGLPTANKTPAKNMIIAARDMIELVRGEMNSRNGLTHFNIRIGIHTGPVVAGIVGIKKWQYDIWGDTVNIAKRMESNSTPSKINISQHTYELIKDSFDCEYRGEVEVKKDKGMMKMYFVNDFKNKAT